MDRKTRERGRGGGERMGEERKRAGGRVYGEREGEITERELRERQRRRQRERENSKTLFYKDCSLVQSKANN